MYVFAVFLVYCTTVLTMGIGKLPTFFFVCFFLNTSCLYKGGSFCSGINLQRKLSINKISPMGKTLACFQLLTLKKNPQLNHKDKICHKCFGFVGEQSFRSLKSLQGCICHCLSLLITWTAEKWIKLKMKWTFLNHKS